MFISYEKRAEDRAKLKELLDDGKHTIKELSELTGIDEETVRNDLALSPELKNHPNIVTQQTVRNEKSKALINIPTITSL